MRAMHSVFEPEERSRCLACLLTQIGDWGKAQTNDFHLTLIILMIALIAGQHWGHERYGGSAESGRAAFDKRWDSVVEN